MEQPPNNYSNDVNKNNRGLELPNTITYRVNGVFKDTVYSSCKSSTDSALVFLFFTEN